MEVITMKKILMVFLITLSLFFPIKAEATHWYLWGDTNYAFWLDDQQITSKTNRSWAAVRIIMEDIQFKEYVDYQDPVIFYKVHDDWFVSMSKDTKGEPLIKYIDWWQPYALEWLIKYNYLKE
jgi:hypothetical protein